MISDIRLSSSLRGHRKIKKLHRRLGAEGVLATIFLWIGAATSKPDGRLVGWDAEDIALEAVWLGNPQEFVQALLDLHLLDLAQDGCYHLHNWHQHQPWVVGADARPSKAKHAAATRWNNLDVCTAHARSMPDAMPDRECSNAPILSSPSLKDSRENSCSSFDEREAPESISGKCPHGKIIDLYHEILPELSRINKALWSGSKDETALRTRWREDPTRQNLDWWQDFFTTVAANDFLMGRVKDWRANLRWLLQRANFIKVLEGAYICKIQHQTVNCSVCRYNIKSPCSNLSRPDFNPGTCDAFQPVEVQK